MTMYQLVCFAYRHPSKVVVQVAVKKMRFFPVTFPEK